MNVHVLAIVILLAVAIGFRLFGLPNVPVSYDEGVNGVLAARIGWSSGYAYAADMFHGPLHFYLTRWAESLVGYGQVALRLPSVVAGGLCVVVCLFARQLLGSAGAFFAAGLVAISPAFVFFNRYGIHESELVLFLIASVLGALKLIRNEVRGGIWLLVLGWAGCVLTKETWTIHFVALAAGSLWVCRGTQWARVWGTLWNRRWHLAAVGSVAMILLVVFYSGHGTHWEGLKEMVKGPFPWLKTGIEAQGHEKPWYYWLELLGTYEWLLLGVLVCAPWLIRSRSREISFLAVVSLTTLVVYSAIPYKTPWCIISICATLPLLGGCLLEDLIRRFPRRLSVIVAILVVAMSLTAVRAWHLAFRAYNDPAEKYVYVPSSSDVRTLWDIFRKLEEVDPHARSTRGNVLYSDPQPIPWILRDYEYVDYFSPGITPPRYDSGFIIAEASRQAEVEANLRRQYWKMPFRTLQQHAPGMLYVRPELFKNAWPTAQQ